MATITQEYWAVVDTFNANPGQTTDVPIRLLNFDPSSVPGYYLIRPEPYSITLEVPDVVDIREKQAEELRAQIRQEQANFNLRITELTAKLNSILAIEG